MCLISLFLAVFVDVSCSPPWIKFESSCHLLMNQTKDWYSAKRECFKYNAKLADCETTGKETFLTSMLKDSDSDTIWVGSKENNESWNDCPSLDNTNGLLLGKCYRLHNFVCEHEG